MSVQVITILLICIKIVFTYFLYIEKRLYKLFIFSLLYGAAMFSFLYARIPNTVTSNHNIFFDLYIMSFLVFVQALFHIFYVLTFLIHKIKDKTKKIFSFALLITVAEIIISLAMSLVFNGNLLPNFTFTNLGFALSFTPLVYFAKYGHVFILTFILSCLIAYTAEIKNKKYFILLYSIFVVTSFLTTDNFIKAESKKEYADLDRVLIKKEDARYIKNDFTNLYKNKYDMVIDGGTIFDNGKMYNVSIFYDIENDKKTVSYKRFLVPFGEYLPYSFEWLKYIYPDVYEKIKQNHTYTAKDKNEVVQYKGKRLVTLLCSDAWSPLTAYNTKKQKADYLILQRSDSGFHYSNFYDANVLMWKSVLINFVDTKVLDVNR